MKHNDDFFDDFERNSRRLMLLNFLLGVAFLGVGFLTLVTTIYFFLAAAGVVPPVDLIPVIPYV